MDQIWICDFISMEDTSPIIVLKIFMTIRDVNCVISAPVHIGTPVYMYTSMIILPAAILFIYMVVVDM